MSSARRRLRPLSFAILLLSTSDSVHPSFFPARWSAEQMSLSVGAATLTSRVRERIGAMMLEVLLARRINRRLGLYFSMVRLRAAWASRVRWSASLITTTLNRCFAPRSTCCVCATSLSNSWTTTRSYCPTSAGVISRWYTDETMLNSSFRLLVVWKTLASILIFSTPGPYSSFSVAIMRVFLPAPEGP